MVYSIQDLHQLLAPFPRLYFIKQIKLRYPGWCEIIQHTACLCVTVTIHPDPVQSSDGSGNDVPCVLRGDEQFFTGHITRSRGSVTANGDVFTNTAICLQN